MQQPTEAQLEAQAEEKRKFSWKILPLFAMTIIVCVVLIVTISDAQSIWDTMKQGNPTYLSLALGFIGLNLLMASIRWRIILHAMGVSLSTRRALFVILATWPFALITPSRASDLLRAVAIRDKLSIAEGSSSVVAEKLVDVQSLCLLATVGSLWAGQWLVAALTLSMLFAEWCVALLLLRYHRRLAAWSFFSKFERKIVRLFKAFEALRQSPRHFLLLSVTSIFSWLMALSVLGMLMLSFGVDVPMTRVLALWPVSIFVGMLPLTVAGMGTRDAAFMALLKITGTPIVNEAPILVATLGYALVTTWLPAVLGFPLMIVAMRTMFASKPTADEPSVTSQNDSTS